MYQISQGLLWVTSQFQCISNGGYCCLALNSGFTDKHKLQRCVRHIDGLATDYGNSSSAAAVLCEAIDNINRWIIKNWHGDFLFPLQNLFMCAFNHTARPHILLYLIDILLQCHNLPVFLPLQSGWGSWGNWGSSLLNTATSSVATFTSQVGKYIDVENINFCILYQCSSAKYCNLIKFYFHWRQDQVLSHIYMVTFALAWLPYSPYSLETTFILIMASSILQKYLIAVIFLTGPGNVVYVCQKQAVCANPQTWWISKVL